MLLLVALVLLPVIFDGEGSYQRELESRIPPIPPFPETETLRPQRPVISADVQEPSTGQEPSANQEPSASEQSVASQQPSSPESQEEVVAADGDQSLASPVPIVESRAVLDNQGLPQGWSVRLASFASTANATALLQQLQNAGHRAYTRQLNSSQGQLTAVFVGPLVDRNAATTLLEQLRQEYQLAGMIVRYEIEAL